MSTKTAVRCTTSRTVLTAWLAFECLWAVSSAACAQSASGLVPATPEMLWNRELLGAGRIQQMAEPLAQASRAAQASVDDFVIARVRSTLPSLEQFGSALRYGNAVVVSSQGPDVVALIRAVPMRKGKERNDVLVKLLGFSRQGIPEAQTFSGFVYEYGLFGAQRNPKLAREYYAAAAAHRYQPAIFNLANMAYFGKGQPGDPEAARELIHQAVGIGPEASGRVCGLASFIEYRRGDQQGALRLGKFCYSGLAHIPNAAYDTGLPLAQRVKMLRDSIATGAPDGYHWLEAITEKTSPDRAYLHCKYRVVNQLRTNPAQADIQALARDCYAASTPGPIDGQAAVTIKGIVSFAVTERRTLDQLRQANRFHDAWSVPYLPFGQGDVDLFESVMKEAR